MNEQELMQKLMMSKAIMDKSENISPKRKLEQNYIDEDYEIQSSPAKYNIPQEFLSEESIPQQYIPTSNPTKAVGVPSVDAIKNSKLPDEIKRLMIEHPIVQPNQGTGPTLSNELVEKASRLMGTSKKTQQTTQTKQNTEGLDYGKIQKMIESAVNKAIKENGLLTESTEKSNESFSFRVGKHIFEGKVTKIRKVS
jgi:hypothetical protein